MYTSCNAWHAPLLALCWSLIDYVIRYFKYSSPLWTKTAILLVLEVLSPILVLRHFRPKYLSAPLNVPVVFFWEFAKQIFCLLLPCQGSNVHFLFQE